MLHDFMSSLSGVYAGVSVSVTPSARLPASWAISTESRKCSPSRRDRTLRLDTGDGSRHLTSSQDRLDMPQHTTTCCSMLQLQRLQTSQFAGIPSFILFSSIFFWLLPTLVATCCPFFVASATCSSRRNSNDAFTSERPTSVGLLYLLVPSQNDFGRCSVPLQHQDKADSSKKKASWSIRSLYPYKAPSSNRTTKELTCLKYYIQ